MNKPKILLFDIETRPVLGYAWELWDTNIIHVVEQPALLSFAYKWLGEKTIVKALPDYKEYKKDKYSDKALVKELWKLFNEADIIIGQNGDKFDTKVSNTRFIFHGFKPPPPYKTVDTLKIARAHFKFKSNRLDDLGEFLGLGRKVKHEGKDLWIKCMNGDSEAWDRMKVYNKQDVVLLEKIYLVFRPWIKNHPNVGLVAESAICPKCGSEKLHSRGLAVTLSAVYKRFQCQDCGGWCRKTKTDLKLANC